MTALFQPNFDDNGKWIPTGVAINAITALTILATLWFLCEWLIRRRAARKGA